MFMADAESKLERGQYMKRAERFQPRRPSAAWERPRGNEGSICGVFSPGVALRFVPNPSKVRRPFPVARTVVALLGACFALGLGTPPAQAQADYRNLDSGRPMAVEDAQPIEYRAMESQYGIPRFSREARGVWLFALEPEFKLGILKNTQVGLSTEYVAMREAGHTVVASTDRQFHLLYNFNQETRNWPAFALRTELAVRSGGLGSRHEHGALKAIISKTFGRNRVHLNGSYTIGPTAAPGRGGELVNRFFYGAAYERTLPLKFLVLLADVYARKPIDHARTQVVFEFGTRVQLNPVWVLDAGISAGLRNDAGPDVGFTFGLSRHFSFRWLYPKKEPPVRTP
jgi:hypothetical protein